MRHHCHRRRRRIATGAQRDDVDGVFGRRAARCHAHPRLFGQRDPALPHHETQRLQAAGQIGPNLDIGGGAGRVRGLGDNPHIGHGTPGGEIHRRGRRGFRQRRALCAEADDRGDEQSHHKRQPFAHSRPHAACAAFHMWCRVMGRGATRNSGVTAFRPASVRHAAATRYPRKQQAAGRPAPGSRRAR